MNHQKNKPKKGKKALFAAFGLYCAGIAGFQLYQNANNSDYLNAQSQGKEIVMVISNQSAAVTPAPVTIENKIANSVPVQTEESKPEYKKPSLTKKIENIDLGIVVCSNQNLLYAKLNKDLLREEGYANTYIQEAKVHGKTFFRTVIGVSNAALESKLEELAKKDFFDTAEGYFTIKGKELSSLTEESEPAKAKRLGMMEKEFEMLVEKSSKKEYSELMKPFIEKTYKVYTGKNIDGKKISEITSGIYDACREFDVPLVEFTALIANESKFRNINGDTWSKNNYSQGYPQIRKKTQKFIFDLMKKAKVSNLPDKLPESLIPFPELQFRMSAFYVDYCKDRAGGDLKKGIAKYNAGHNSDKENTQYTSRVIGEKANMHRYVSSQ